MSQAKVRGIKCCNGKEQLIFRALKKYAVISRGIFRWNAFSKLEENVYATLSP